MTRVRTTCFFNLFPAQFFQHTKPSEFVRNTHINRWSAVNYDNYSLLILALSVVSVDRAQDKKWKINADKEMKI